MRVAGDTVEAIICVALAIAMLTPHPTSAPQQCCWVGISHGGTSAVPPVVTDVPRSADAEAAAAAIGIECPDIDTLVSMSAELAIAS